jgi:hypothetical protein
MFPILPEPACKVEQRNAGIGDLGMPFLFPLKRREELVIELAKCGPNFGQRKIPGM